MNDISELKQQVQDLRGTLAGLRTELDTLKGQARSRREVRGLVVEQVAAWRTQISTAVEVDLQRMIAGQSVPLFEMRAGKGSFALGPAFVAVMGETALTKWLTSLTDGLPEGLESEQRAERMFDIGREIDMLAAAEEALLREADDLGYPIDPRPDADPRAAILLGFAK